ncbi:MAG: molybdate ABC transporter substrate-binding protein [Methanoculleus bourgensis]|jgi:molybdate transport system substrate-binding protein|uniref:Molybdenum ABC transporter, periplasmic molybdate-binding protein n=2 Tax=Methanoculleus bourgensis TaxID=83986 RepID=I7KXB9_METBM|nr:MULTISPECIES: molybdate ABC transporter substrate-binding protein [Methanoculleus]MDD3372904.1 molybdate ABC transporter substrate-binding protein [Methanoculleus bourgensis]NMA88771.1 molybdate ABC transporter substrate-binding protein [Methanoculleus bourgensis]NQS77454.1 molybdate ABC transporter substrate-binding protein [Methanoculleus bourgensis]CCJ35060.1 molybdenum ABC transporter, periplasmic molybdate-binding protein [Methanoculleus bourgensis MS2]
MMKKAIALITIVILAGLLCTAGCTSQQAPATGDNTTPGATDTSILVYSGAGLKKPMNEIGAAFTEKTGINVEYNFAGSGTLISQMELSRKGDAFIPGGTPDYRIAQDKGLVGEPGYVAYHVPIIAVQKGNPQNITSVDDFARPGLKIALGGAESTAIGRAGDKLFQKHGILDAVEKNVVLRAPTINEVVVAMNMGTADAALLTLDMINPEKMDTIDLAQEDGLTLIVPIGQTTFTTQPDTARQFATFVTSDEGKAIFAKHGFPTYPDPAYAGIEP